MSFYPFVAEICIFPFNFAPKGWVVCDGQLLPISSYTAVFSLLGTNYGGDGRSTFGLPDLQGSIAIHTDEFSGSGQYFLGQSGGEDTVELIESEIPQHTHTVTADGNHLHDTLASPSGGYFVNASPNLTFSSGQASPSLASMNPAMVGVAGSSGGHNNLMPYLTLTFCIALQGVYPPRT
jgi:microcystin-dependent protein